MNDIVHLIHSGGFYGAERMLLDHCRVTPGRHRVVFLDAPAELLARFRAAGVDCRSCAGLGELLDDLRSRPGLLNAHNFRAQVFAWLCASRLDLPLVLTQHGFTPRSLKQRIYTRVSLLLCRSPRVRRVVCVAQSIARLHESAGVRARKLLVIPNGLPDEPALPAGSVSEPLLGFVGRLSAEKGPDLFLDAVIPLCHARPQLHAVLLGDGPERDALAARIAAAGLQERIHLAGYQQDMPTWLARLSVLVLSSRTEGTPMILLEAMRAGVPVAAFGVGGVPDMLEDERSALLARPGDVAALGALVARLLDDRHLALRLTAEARRRQLDQYHLPTLAQRWDQLYLAAAGGQPS